MKVSDVRMTKLGEAETATKEQARRIDHGTAEEGDEPASLMVTTGFISVLLVLCFVGYYFHHGSQDGTPVQLTSGTELASLSQSTMRRPTWVSGAMQGRVATSRAGSGPFQDREAMGSGVS